MIQQKETWKLGKLISWTELISARLNRSVKNKQMFKKECQKCVTLLSFLKTINRFSKCCSGLSKE
jgi:hypothetical protein